MTANSERTIGFLFLVIGIGGVLMSVASAVLGVDMNKGGGAMLLLGGLAGIIGFVSAAIYFKRAKIVAGITSGEKLLVDWKDTADPEEPLHAIISSEGMIFNGEVLPFADFSCKIEAVSVEPANAPKRLMLILSTAGKGFRRKHHYDIGIPEGQTEAALKVVELLRKKYLS